jgi:acetyltransferase-like isoleucine patch superfamily enzyme
VPLLLTGPAFTVPATAVGCVPASVVTPLAAVTAFHTFACCVVLIAEPIANASGVVVGGGVVVVAGGVVGGGVVVGAEQPLTLITGIVPDEENATLHPVGATT